MIRSVFGLFLLLLSCSNTDTRSTHSVYISRKSDSVPLEKAYMYSRLNKVPARLAMMSNRASDYNAYTFGKSYDFPVNVGHNYDFQNPFGVSESHPIKETYKLFTETPPYYFEDNGITKQESQFDTGFLPSQVIESNDMYENRKSASRYLVPRSTDANPDYQMSTSHDYQNDDDDIRTSSRSTYDTPYFYHTPYEYEAKKYGSDVQKDYHKRFNPESVIPVHEHIDDDVPHTGHIATRPTYQHHHVLTTDNPVFGDQPFFSFILNDYFDKSIEEDPLVFKGLGWGKEFDNSAPNIDNYDIYRRDRRKELTYLSSPSTNDSQKKFASTSEDNDDEESDYSSTSDSTTETGFTKDYTSNDDNEEDDSEKENHKSTYAHKAQKQNAFKHFTDDFANKFGGEEHVKDVKYNSENNKGKGEKRKGFRRIYHKDEYQEDNEFYDNNNSSNKAEEKGHSFFHNGGSSAILQSQAVAAVGDEANAHLNTGETKKSKSKNNNHRDRESQRAFHTNFNKYRDVARLAALSNNADYADNFKQ